MSATRPANARDLVTVLYAHVDAVRREIGVAPLRLERTNDGGLTLKVSVREGFAAEVPRTVLVTIGGDLIEISLEAHEDYERRPKRR